MSCSDDTGAIELFAECSEALNEFSRNLRDIPAFGEVRTGTDIRNYDSGWRLEKYIEAELAGKKGLWAVWWLELGQRDSSWVVETSVSVSHSDVYMGNPEHIAKNTQELKMALKQSVDMLIASAEKKHAFFREIKKLQTDNN